VRNYWWRRGVVGHRYDLNKLWVPNEEPGCGRWGGGWGGGGMGGGGVFLVLVFAKRQDTCPLEQNFLPKTDRQKCGSTNHHTRASCQRTISLRKRVCRSKRQGEG